MQHLHCRLILLDHRKAFNMKLFSSIHYMVTRRFIFISILQIVHCIFDQYAISLILNQTRVTIRKECNDAYTCDHLFDKYLDEYISKLSMVSIQKSIHHKNLNPNIRNNFQIKMKPFSLNSLLYASNRNKSCRIIFFPLLSYIYKSNKISILRNTPHLKIN